MCNSPIVLSSGKDDEQDLQEDTGVTQQQAAAGVEEDQELQQQLQRQTDKMRSMAETIQHLERQLKQARKAISKLDSVKAQLKQEQAEKQQLTIQLMLMQHELQTAQGKLAGQQRAASRQQVQVFGSSGSNGTQSTSANAAKLEDQQRQQQQQQQQQEQTENSTGAAGRGRSRRVVAFVGGRAMKASDRKLLPLDAEVRFYGSPQDAVSGERQRLINAIKAGSIDEVFLSIRWNSHSTTQLVSKLCRDLSIPCQLLTEPEKARRKGEWAATMSGSDTDSSWEPC